MNKILLRETWTEARKYLPGYVYAVLYQNQKNSFETDHNKPSPLEKIALKKIDRDNLKVLKDRELRQCWSKVVNWFSSMQKDQAGYQEYLELGSVFVQEFKARGLSPGNWKIVNMTESLKKQDIPDGFYNLQDIWDWMNGDVCKIKYDKKSFSNIDTIEKLKYAMYVAISLNAPFVKVEKNEDDDLVYFLRYGLEVKAFDGKVFGVDNQELGILDEKMIKGSKYKIEPGFVLGLDDIEKISFIKSKKTTLEADSNLQEFLNNYRCVQNLKKEIDLLPFFGSEESGIVFMGLSPDLIEQSTEQFFTNKSNKVFKEQYLKFLGLHPHQVLLGNVVPVPVFDDQGKRRKPIKKEIDNWKFFRDLYINDDMYVIALGKSTEQALQGRADFVLPHPKALVYKKDSGEVRRKLKSIKKILDKKHKDKLSCKKVVQSTLADADISDTQDGIAEASLTIQIQKADQEKQIVYGIVSDPYGKNGPELDAHADWIPPADVEAMSHEYMLNSRMIKFQHQSKSNSKPVESFLEPYPNKAEYQKAMKNEPHTIYRRAFGNDVIHSGSWVMATKLCDDDWKAYKAGEINAYSIGGTGKRQPLKQSDMPQVKIIDLVADKK